MPYRVFAYTSEVSESSTNCSSSSLLHLSSSYCYLLQLFCSYENCSKPLFFQFNFNLMLIPWSSSLQDCVALLICCIIKSYLDPLTQPLLSNAIYACNIPLLKEIYILVISRILNFHICYISNTQLETAQELKGQYYYL